MEEQKHALEKEQRQLDEVEPGREGVDQVDGRAGGHEEDHRVRLGHARVAETGLEVAVEVENGVPEVNAVNAHHEEQRRLAGRRHGRGL